MANDIGYKPLYHLPVWSQLRTCAKSVDAEEVESAGGQSPHILSARASFYIGKMFACSFGVQSIGHRVVQHRFDTSRASIGNWLVGASPKSSSGESRSSFTTKLVGFRPDIMK